MAALETALAAAIATIACMHMQGTTELVVEGCNVHVRSGGGATDAAVNGVGNLVIGYNQSNRFGVVRTGSHNVVVGPRHTYSSCGGLVAGEDNTVTGPFASVSGGRENTASGKSATVSGGANSGASGAQASVSGGFFSTASGNFASVSGGNGRSATGAGSWAAGSLFEDF